MERIAQLFDELDDLVCALRHRLGLWPAASRARRA
jgi:hypothetical protein